MWRPSLLQRCNSSSGGLSRAYGRLTRPIAPWHRSKTSPRRWPVPSAWSRRGNAPRTVHFSGPADGCPYRRARSRHEPPTTASPPTGPAHRPRAPRSLMSPAPTPSRPWILLERDAATVSSATTTTAPESDRPSEAERSGALTASGIAASAAETTQALGMVLFERSLADASPSETTRITTPAAKRHVSMRLSRSMRAEIVASRTAIVLHQVLY